jgi:perosamine synthetase
LTTGPRVSEFEKAFAEKCGVKEAVAVSNGTAALHSAMYALNIKNGDEVIVPSLTFASTANCVVFQGAIPVFADVDPDTLLINPASVEENITDRTKAIIGVDFAGQPCDYDVLWEIADRHDLVVVDDACHALGAFYKNTPAGALAELNTFSFHPVKNMTTGEGGMITTDNPALASRMRIFRNHGITTDHRQREEQGSWYYEMVDLGFNYRLTDFQCALGLTQLKKLSEWVRKRQEIAQIYNAQLGRIPGITLSKVRDDVSHAYHLYIIKLKLEEMREIDRMFIFKALRAEGIGVNVHYIPVHLHPFYRNRYGTKKGQCPVAEMAYNQILSLPIFPRMTNHDIDDVIKAINKVMCACI